MNRVERCHLGPHHCAVFPHLGQTQRRGYFDTGTDLPGPGIHLHRVYVSVEAAEMMARKLGWVSSEEATNISEQLSDVLAQLDQAKAELAEYDQRFSAIDVLESQGFRARRKTGPKRVEA